jgi:hypothetical protein
MKQLTIALFSLFAVTYSCGQTESKVREGTSGLQGVTASDLINESGKTIEDRFIVPESFIRVQADDNSFAAFLRKLPLKPHNSKVKLYNGNLKANQDAHAAVVDMDPGKRDLQQCADAIIRLRAEYLYNKQEYDNIHFNFTNGFRAGYSKWMQGYRVKVEGNRTYWVKSGPPSNKYDEFRKYLDLVFTYAGTLSLSKELIKKEYRDICAGDIFIQGGSPGHAVIVVDMAVNKDTGKKIYLLAQGYMPAQEIHILKNPENTDNPWYEANEDDEIIRTPEWTFYQGDLRRFAEDQ